MAKRYFQMFEVEGSTAFPIDMLRYDACHPHTGEDAALIASSERIETHGKIKVRLVRFIEHVSQHPTEARWESFLWRVVPGSVKTTKFI